MDGLGLCDLAGWRLMLVYSGACWWGGVARAGGSLVVGCYPVH